MKTEVKENPNMPLAGKNYILIGCCVVLIVIGFLLMSGGGSEDAVHEFNYDMFSTRRIVVAPLVLLSGFVLGVFAIVKRFK